MKFLVALSTVAAVSAQVALPYALPYAYGLHAFGGKSAPCVNAANEPVPCAGAPLAYAGLPYAHGLFGRKKREAEAEPEADAYYGHYGYAGHGYGHGYGHVLGLKSAPCVNAANAPVPCAAGYHAYGYGHGYYGKREAEADAQVVLAGAAYPYAGLGYAGLGHAGLGYAGALGYGIPNPVHAVAHTAAGLVHSSHVGLCTNYLGAAVPCRRKREAEAGAEADAAVLYAGYGYPAYGYAGLGHAGLGYAGLGHAGLGYAGLPYHAGVVAPAVAHAVVAPVAIVHNAVLGTAELPNPVHAVAHTIYGAVHSSHVGVCTNYLGEQVSC